MSIGDEFKMSTIIKDVPVMILCGGKGTRLRDVTEMLPKPMVAIGEQPIVWHIMKTFAAFGCRRFILCLGYKREVFVDYFMNYHLRTSDATICLGHQPDVRFFNESSEADWEVTLAGTGLEAMTGCRVKRASKYLKDRDKCFFLTYGDGVCDLNVAELYKTHCESGKMLTMTAVHPEARFGQLLCRGNDLIGFEEKPLKGGDYINGGYMVVNREFVDKYIYDDESLILERAPLADAAADGNVGVFKHDDFWQCMDNQREYLMLNNLWSSGEAPWTKYWK